MNMARWHEQAIVVSAAAAVADARRAVEDVEARIDKTRALVAAAEADMAAAVADRDATRAERHHADARRALADLEAGDLVRARLAVTRAERHYQAVAASTRRETANVLAREYKSSVVAFHKAAAQLEAANAALGTVRDEVLAQFADERGHGLVTNDVADLFNHPPVLGLAATTPITKAIGYWRGRAAQLGFRF